ncbi:MAG: hypothetical protein H6747_02745 [Deltaproteobacteria bacterium]|nr:hypothetical protein [Deltaproteobacteria bacterium]
MRRASRTSAIRWGLLVGVIAQLLGCGTDGDGGGAAGKDAGATVDSGGGNGCGLPGSSFVAGPAVSTDDISIAVQHLGASVTVKGKLFLPSTCSKVAPCPLLVVVPDRDTSPIPQWQNGATRLAEATSSIVALWNPPGTGIGGHKTGGENDFGGELHAAATKEVMRLLSDRSQVDKTRCGYVTIGTGLLPAAAALRKFSQSSLGFVQFLLDVEGPSDRCAASQAPENPALSIGPDDGPGATESACNFTAEHGHAEAYPVASDTAPASIICAPGAWPITETGNDCKDDGWWSPREPARQLASAAVKVRYQRVAFRNDHRMASKHASRVMITAMAKSKSGWFTVNDMPPCQPVLDDASCEALAKSCQRCWLEGTWGNGMAPAPYAADLAEITIDELLGDVLPRFVARVTDEKTNPACR